MNRMYSFFRSGTSHRLRIALNLKNIPYDIKPINLRSAEHKSDPFLKLNPQGLVPVVDFEEDGLLTQTPAIIEYLDEKWPDNPLFPTDIKERAQARAMAALIGCDIHPVNNLRILNALKKDFKADEEDIKNWTNNWINDGFRAIEISLAERVLQGGFAFGNQPGVVECYLIPQVFSAERFEVDMSAYPKIVALNQTCEALTAFKQAHPQMQADAV